jgi:DNA-binding beta-propeller fold protein YncE
VNNIERRNFLFIILLIVLIGTAGLLALWLFFAFGSGRDDTVTSNKNRPEYLSSIDLYDKQKLLSPMGVAFRGDKLYALDSGNKQIAIFSQNGLFEKSVALSSIAGKNTPVGIAVDDRQRIYVSLIGTANKIAVFDSSRKFLYFFPQKNPVKAGDKTTAGKATFGRPVGLLATGNKLYVTDVVDQDIKVFDLSGSLLMKFGRPGNKKGEFLYPNGVTVSDDGKIFVSDSNNARIQVFDQKGTFLFMFSGSKKERLALPRGLAFDKRGLLHVVDTLKHKVFVFNKQGKQVYSYGSFGNRGAGLLYPNAIVFNDAFEKIYIADKQNNRISVWKP